MLDTQGTQIPVNNYGFNGMSKNDFDELKKQIEKQGKMIVDILIAVKDTYPDLVVKYLDEIAEVKDES